MADSGWKVFIFFLSSSFGVTMMASIRPDKIKSSIRADTAGRGIMKKINCWNYLVLTVFLGILLWIPLPVHAEEEVKTAAVVTENQGESKEESKEPQQDIAAYQAVFDAAYYYCAYPDVAAAFGPDYSLLLQHYITNGAKEGRSASAKFNATYYKERYADLQKVFGDNLSAYCRHYLMAGKKEGRVANTPEAANVDTSNAPDGLNRAGTVLGTCTTSYKAGIPRAVNVELAASRINGQVLQPGQQFSYNIAVLPRTTENGYVTAPVFVNGGHGMGIGGGICQVSSTLYAAMLNGGVPATERHPHSLPVSYLPAGYDATIAGNSKDLKFVNIYEQPLMIQASAVNGVLTVSLVLL